MAALTEEELIQIRRHLHEIPELALQEKETHAYLLDVIKQMKQDYLTIREPAELPSARLDTGRISMLCRLRKKPACHLNPSIPM